MWKKTMATAKKLKPCSYVSHHGRLGPKFCGDEVRRHCSASNRWLWRLTSSLTQELRDGDILKEQNKNMFRCIFWSTVWMRSYRFWCFQSVFVRWSFAGGSHQLAFCHAELDMEMICRTCHCSVRSLLSWIVQRSFMFPIKQVETCWLTVWVCCYHVAFMA